MFNKAMNFNNIDGLGSIIESDSSYYCSGSTQGVFGKRLLIRFGKNGDTVFVKSYGADSSLYYLGVGKTILKRNHKFYLLGTRFDASTSVFHANLTITNEQGDSIKSVDVAGVDSTYGQGGMIFDRYGDLMISGHFYLSATDVQGMLLKCDSLGTLKWIKYYGGPNVESFYSIDTTTDGGYIMAGLTDSYGSGLWDVYVVKVDSGGVFQWHKYFGSTSSDAGFIQTLSDGNYLIFGGNYVTGYTEQKGFIRKLNSSGNLIWHKNFINLSTSSEKFYSMAVDSLNNSFVFGGIMYDPSINSGNPVGYFVRTDTSGNQIFYRTYKISDNDNYINDVIISSDNHIVACGYIFPDGAGVLTEDGWIIKLDSVGCLVSGCNLGVDEDEKKGLNLNIYPNPSNGNFLIEISENEKSDNSYYHSRLFIRNSLGQLVFETALKSNRTPVSLQNLAKGLYFLTLAKEHGKTINYKIILE